MIYPVTMYAAKCDNCGKEYVEEHNGWSAFVDENAVFEYMDSDGWYEDDGKHYCPDCFTIDDDDKLHLKTIE